MKILVEALQSFAKFSLPNHFALDSRSAKIPRHAAAQEAKSSAEFKLSFPEGLVRNRAVDQDQMLKDRFRAQGNALMEGARM